MELHQIRYFLAICETLNFTRAAEVCNVTQPALTRAMQKLEDELGGQLIRRERGLTHLTELGKLMRPHLTQILEQSEGAKSAAKGFLKPEKSPLHLGLMCTIGPLRMVDFLFEQRRLHPGIELFLHEGTSRQLSEQLTEGKIDAALMAQPQPFDETFEAHPLYSEHFTVAFPPGHRYEGMAEVRIADLDGEDYLLRVNCEHADLLRGLCTARGVQRRITYRSEREDWIQTMIMAGMGVCFLPEYSIVVDGVLTRPVAEPSITRAVNVVTVAGRRFSPALASFIEDIKAYSWANAIGARGTAA